MQKYSVLCSFVSMNGIKLVLNEIRTDLFRIKRLIEIENFEDARTLILQCKISLNRIQPSLSVERHSIINTSLDHLFRLIIRADKRGAVVDNSYKPEKIKNGKGRPSLLITREQLTFFLKERYTATTIARVLGCSKQLIYKRCYEEGLKFRQNYTQMADDLLSSKISKLKEEFPNAGAEMMCAYLKTQDIVVPRERVRKILRIVDPVGTAARWTQTKKRRNYSVPAPNALWHMDAHLKLIRWGFVTHGCIDGFSRLIIYIECTTSITAECVINIFTPSVTKYGLPSRVRSDHGFENLFVAILMNTLRGIQRTSHITGKSTHNQRIERLWRDVFSQVVDKFYAEFYSLEEEGYLDPDNAFHKHLLQVLYIPKINENLSLFQSSWNNHKVRTSGRRTPRQIWLDGMLNNINSDYTSITEIFEHQAGIKQRIKDSLIRMGVNIDQIITTHIPQQSTQLSPNIVLSEDDDILLERIKGSDTSTRDKYIAAVTQLTN